MIGARRFCLSRASIEYVTCFELAYWVLLLIDLATDIIDFSNIYLKGRYCDVLLRYEPLKISYKNIKKHR